MVCTSCKFTALVVAHTKRRIQTFLLLSNTFATIGPAWSIPTTENGRWSETLSCGRGGETSIPEGASKRRQTVHWLFILRTMRLHATTAKRRRANATQPSTPRCMLLSWMCRSNKTVRLWSARTMGYFVSSSKSESCSLRLALIIPSSSTHGRNCSSLESLWTLWLAIKLVISWGKHSRWIILKIICSARWRIFALHFVAILPRQNPSNHPYHSSPSGQSGPPFLLIWCGIAQLALWLLSLLRRYQCWSNAQQATCQFL